MDDKYCYNCGIKLHKNIDYKAVVQMWTVSLLDGQKLYLFQGVFCEECLYKFSAEARSKFGNAFNPARKLEEVKKRDLSPATSKILKFKTGNIFYRLMCAIKGEL